MLYGWPLHRTIQDLLCFYLVLTCFIENCQELAEFLHGVHYGSPMLVQKQNKTKHCSRNMSLGNGYHLDSQHVSKGGVRDKQVHLLGFMRPGPGGKKLAKENQGRT